MKRSAIVIRDTLSETLAPEEASSIAKTFVNAITSVIDDPELKAMLEEVFKEWLEPSSEVLGQAEQMGRQMGQAVQEGLESIDLVPSLDVSLSLSEARNLGQRIGSELADSIRDVLGGFEVTLTGGFGILRQLGGFVPGQGSGDRVPALLEPGEFVWPKELVRQYPEVIVGLWKKFRFGGFVGYQAGGAVLAAGGGEADILSGLAGGFSKFLDVLNRIISGLYDFLKPLVRGEEEMARFEEDFAALRGLIAGFRDVAANADDAIQEIISRTQQQAQATIDQAEKMARSGQAAEGLQAQLEKLTFPSAEAGQTLRQLALEGGRSAKDLIAIHAKAQDLISVAKDLYDAQRFFGLSTEQTIESLRSFLSAVGLSEVEIESIVADIVSASQDLASAFSKLISQAEALTLAQTGQILALREQALAVLESGKVTTEEGEIRRATIGEIIAAAGAVSSFSSWLDATITTLERLITAGNEAVRPLYEQLTKLREGMALGPTFEEQRRAQERAAEEAKRRQEELARKAREAFEESFRKPIKEALETGDWMEAALAVREMAKQKDNLIAQAKALPAVQGKTMELAEVYDLLIGAQRELLSSIDKEIAVRQIAGENVDALEELKTQIEELFDPLGEWKKALREAISVMAEDPLKASQGLRELFLKAKELGTGSAEAARRADRAHGTIRSLHSRSAL